MKESSQAIYNQIVRENLIAALIGKELAKRNQQIARNMRDQAETQLQEAMRISAAVATKLRIAREQVDKATPDDREAQYIVDDATERAETYLRGI